MSSDKSNERSAAFERGEADAQDNNYNPPSGPSMITCTLDQHEADRQTQEVTDYRGGYHRGGGQVIAR